MRVVLIQLLPGYRLPINECHDVENGRGGVKKRFRVLIPTMLGMSAKYLPLSYRQNAQIHAGIFS